MIARRATGLAFLCAALITSAAGSAVAQPLPPPKASQPVPSPGKAIASDDDASAIAVNAANLAFLPAPELRWTWVWTDERSPFPNRGHSIEAGLPFWFFATGLRVDFLDPRGAAPPPFDDTYQWVRWSLAARAGEVASIGTTFGWSMSGSDSLDNYFSLSTGVTLRPFTWISLSAVARDWNLPRSATGEIIERSYDFGLALRPGLGHRAFEIGAESAYLATSEEWVPRATVGIDVPRIGRLRGDVTIVDPDDDPRFVVTAGLDVNVGGMQASGGVVFRDATDRVGFYAGAAVRAYREPGVRLPVHVARVRIDATPGVRGHTRLLRRLWRLSSDPEVEAVLLVLRDEPASSLAHAEEVGDAIRLLRARGKKVICHLEDAGGRSLHVCSQADRIAMNPAGGLRFSGLSSRYLYFNGLLKKLGVRADFVRIGAHKLAAEQFTRESGTEIARQDHQELLAQYEQVYLNDVGGGRRIPAAELKRRLASGPFLASEAKAAGLIDTLAYDDEIDRVVEEVVGRGAKIADDDAGARMRTYWADTPKVAVIYLSGDMIDGESQSIPVIGIKLAGSQTIARALKRARDDSSVRAVVFRIETGGGSSLAADVILREAILTARAKPLVVSMGSSAASGGYYASMAGNPVYANRGTLTGSIGIFYGKVDVVGLLNNFGVNVETFRTSPRADAESFFRPFTDDEHRELGIKVKQFYDLFIARVAEGRHMTPAAVDAVARGHVWTGAQALPLKLVDKIGGLRQALQEARALAHLPNDSPLVEYPEEDESLLGILLNLVGLSAADTKAALAEAFIPPALMDAARALSPFMVFDPGSPLARVEFHEELSFGKPSKAVDGP